MTNLTSILANPRVTVRRAGPPDPYGRCVVYWMQRAQRGLDNPALDVAIQIANELQRPLAVFFGLHPKYPHANKRHYQFLVDGLKETSERIEARGAAFVFRPYPDHNLLRFCTEVQPCVVIGDENPMREPEGWRLRATQELTVPFYTVDADVIVPTKYFPKEEYAARTIRPKLQKLLPLFLVPSDNPCTQQVWTAHAKPRSTCPIDASILKTLLLARAAQPVGASKGGTAAGLQRLQAFIRDGLSHYDTARNLPHLDGTSNLSAFLHFGQIGPLTIALAVQDAAAPQAAKNAYLEELIVRRELAINFVARNPQYDQLAGCHEWARNTLAAAASDPRPILYDDTTLENAETYDALWNAAQLEMMKTGRMHGYLRMYWAKKILEWKETPEEAFALAVELNDRYQLDGRDPNGYTGIAWAIGGKHDRPWGPRRPIFGLIRYMSAEGCKRKFDVVAYQSKIARL